MCRFTYGLATLMIKILPTKIKSLSTIQIRKFRTLSVILVFLIVINNIGKPSLEPNQESALKLVAAEPPTVLAFAFGLAMEELTKNGSTTKLTRPFVVHR